jgi:hypothetical protein
MLLSATQTCSGLLKQNFTLSWITSVESDLGFVFVAANDYCMSFYRNKKFFEKMWRSSNIEETNQNYIHE